MLVNPLLSTMRSVVGTLALLAEALPGSGGFPERSITLVVPFADHHRKRCSRRLMMKPKPTAWLKLEP